MLFFLIPVSYIYSYFISYVFFLIIVHNFIFWLEDVPIMLWTKFYFLLVQQREGAQGLYKKKGRGS